VSPLPPCAWPGCPLEGARWAIVPAPVFAVLPGASGYLEPVPDTATGPPEEYHRYRVLVPHWFCRGHAGSAAAYGYGGMSPAQTTTQPGGR